MIIGVVCLVIMFLVVSFVMCLLVCVVVVVRVKFGSAVVKVVVFGERVGVVVRMWVICCAVVVVGTECTIRSLRILIWLFLIVCASSV